MDAVREAIREVVANADYTPPHDEQVESELDPHRNAPQPDPACLYGLIGEIAEAASRNTEANPYAVAANALVYLSCAVGRGPFMPVGNTWHHARLFGLHVGRSGAGRKGEAISLIKRLHWRLRELDEAFAPQMHAGGLSSREGMVYLIHDGYTMGKEEVPPIEDKRLFVVESEFANVLHQGKREGNTLSTALRDCWDGVDLRPATKTNRLWASNPHVCLSAAITPTELLSCIAARDLSNGFANRFMIFWSERPGLVPMPKATPQEEVSALADKIMAVLKFCNADRWVDRDHLRIELDADAQKLYADLYRGELNTRKYGERIAGLIERRAPMLLRIAMLLALTDQTATVNEGHILAALAWVRYSVESVRFIFSDVQAEVETAEVNEIGAKIVQFIQARKRVTRTEITRDLFQGHTTKTRIDAALDELLKRTPPAIYVESDRTGPGRPAKYYTLPPAKEAKQAKEAEPRGLQADSDVCERSELSELMEAN